MAGRIHLADALNIADEKDVHGRKKPFAIKWVSFNKSKQEGGEIMELTEAVKVGSTHSQKDNDLIVVKQLHNSHHPMPVHIRLIIEFNGLKVYY